MLAGGLPRVFREQQAALSHHPVDALVCFTTVPTVELQQRGGPAVATGRTYVHDRTHTGEHCSVFTPLPSRCSPRPTSRPEPRTRAERETPTAGQQRASPGVPLGRRRRLQQPHPFPRAAGPTASCRRSTSIVFLPSRRSSSRGLPRSSFSSRSATTASSGCKTSQRAFVHHPLPPEHHARRDAVRPRHRGDALT